MTATRWIAELSRRQLAEPLPVINTFGPRTHDAVKAFQRLNGLDDDGKVGELTASQLLSICEFTAEYTIEREPEFAIEGGVERDEPTTIETEYELKDGVQVSVDPWKPPPGPLQYKLEFEAAWIVKNPGALPVSLGLSVGAEIGRTTFLPSLDIPYVTSGGGTVAARVQKDFSVGPVRYDITLQNSFEIEQEAHEPEVKASAAVSVASGISVAVVRNRFYLFTQGELAAALKWEDGTLHPSMQFQGTTGVKFTF